MLCNAEISCKTFHDIHRLKTLSNFTKQCSHVRLHDQIKKIKVFQLLRLIFCKVIIKSKVLQKYGFEVKKFIDQKIQTNILKLISCAQEVVLSV